MINHLSNKIPIKSLIQKAGLKTRGEPNYKGWLSILCPFHDDKNFGSCSINIETGIISCWVCGSHHISQLVKDNFENTSITYVPPAIKEEHSKKSERYDHKYLFINKKVNPNDYFYLKQRGFSPEFCDEFNIVHCFTFPYLDYFTMLVKDSVKGIVTIEFRKLKEYEYLQKFFDNYDNSFPELKGQFKKYIIDNKIEFKNYVIYKNGQIVSDDTLLYLLDKKVKYEKYSAIKETIWNIDNLDYNKILYLVEGIGSLPKIYNYISKNCTCTFGSKITEAQLEYLRKFKHIIIIPDNDEAGFNMVNALHLDKDIKKLSVLSIDSEDTDEDYIFKIKNTNILKVRDYIAKSIMKYTKGLF